MKRILILVVLALVACVFVARAHAQDFDLANDQVALFKITTTAGDHIDSNWNSYPKPVLKEDSPLIGGEVNVHSDKVPYATLQSGWTRGDDDVLGVAELGFKATVKGVEIGPVVFFVNVIKAGEPSSPEFTIESNGLVVTLFRYQEKP